jgi:hypothetical protein
MSSGSIGAQDKANKAEYGAGIYLAGNATINSGDISNNEASLNGGAVYVENGGVLTLSNATIKNNTVIANTEDRYGAGIYLSAADSSEGSGAILNISGNPVFQGNTVVVEGYSDKQNGGNAYTDNKVNVDIYLAEGGTEENHAPESIIVTGDLTGENGSIWVWADNEYHRKQFMPFAKLKDGVTFSENNNPAVFYNARDDEATENRTGDILYGYIDDDPTTIVWYGVSGNRIVILRKVGSGSYQSLEGAEFIVYANAQGTRIAKDANNNPLGSETEPLVSDANGTFFVGRLNFGTYYVKETKAPTSPTGYTKPADGKYFIITVNENGVGYLDNGELSNEVSAVNP